MFLVSSDAVQIDQIRSIQYTKTIPWVMKYHTPSLSMNVYKALSLWHCLQIHMHWAIHYYANTFFEINILWINNNKDFNFQKP